MCTWRSRRITALAMPALGILLAASTASAQTALPCPKEAFDHLMVLVADTTLAAADFSVLSSPDPNLSYLKEVLHSSPAEAQKFLADGEAFFRSRFGLDFSAITADEKGMKTLPKVGLLMPFRVMPEINYRVIYANGVGQSKECPAVQDGGLMVVITDPGFRYHGSYAGQDGIPATPGDMIVYGSYALEGLGDGTSAGPLVIHYEAAAPMRSTVDGDAPINCSLVHPVWGPGMGRGLYSMFTTPVTDEHGQTRVHAHISIRNVLTFPGQARP